MTTEQEETNRVEEVKKKYNLSDEALGEIAEIVAPTPASQEPSRTEGDEDGGLFGHMNNNEFTQMQKMFGGGGDISLGSALVLMSYWDKQEERRERKERERLQTQEETKWAKELVARLDRVEGRITYAPPSSSPDSATSKLYDDLKERLQKSEEANKEVLAELKEERDKARDAETRQYLDSKIGEVNVTLSTLQTTIANLKPPEPKDTVEEYIASKTKLEGAGILKPPTAAEAKSREELRTRAQSKVLDHLDKAAESVRTTFDQIKDSVIIPRMRVESGVSNVASLSEKERADYYNRLKIPTQ